MKAYKGFNADLTCQGFQYEIGKTYEMSDKVEVCKNGYHACEYPLDVFNYYGPTSRFAEVDLDGEISRNKDKVSSAKITIHAEIDLSIMVQESVKFILSKIKKTKKETNTGYQSAATNTGDQSAATNTGDQSAATNTGYQSAATNTGDQSAATNTGDQSAATNTGNWSAATNTGYQSAATNTGDQSAATNTGNWSAATNTGDQSAATNTGDQSAATNTGYQSAATVSGRNSIAIASGYKSKAKACEGSAIVCVYRNDNGDLIHIKSAIVGEDVKPDTWYSLDQNGEFVEVSDND